MPDQRLKVLLVHSTLHIGGAEEVSVNICRRIDRHRFDVHVCFLKEAGMIAEKIEQEGTTVHAVGVTGRSRPDYLTSMKLRALVAREKFDIIHSHDVHSLVDGSVCRLTSPRLKHVHTFHFGNYPKRESGFRRKERLAWRIPDRLVAVSDHQRRGIRDLYGIPENRISTVWNGVDVLPALPAVPEINIYREEGRVVIGCVNTLTKQKGMSDLIQVALQLKARGCPPFVFLIAGDGGLKEELKDEVARYGVENEVVFLGWVKQAAQSVLPYIDIFFQPSLWEAMSIVLLEAMALGRTIVTTAVGETPRIITSGLNVHVVSPGDVGAMTSKLQELIMNREARADLGATAMHHYQENFTGARLAERHEILYQDMAS